MNKFNKALMAGRKHAPLLLTIGGIALGVTSTYLAVRASKELDKKLAEYEILKEEGNEINNIELAIDVAKIVAIPAVVSIASMAFVGSSWFIQNNRITVLSTALSTLTTRFLEYQKDVVGKLGKEVAQELNAKLDAETNEEGVITEVKKARDYTTGIWYSESYEYEDDHEYNMHRLRSVREKLETKLFQKGHILLNEVFDELGFERQRNGALLGWSAAHNMDLNIEVYNVLTENGNYKPAIRVSWNVPRYVWDTVEYEGRYSL